MSETSALRVVFETRLNEPLVQCPCCLEKKQDGCWSCEGCRWDKASAWEWSYSVAEQVREWGGSDAAVDRVRHLTIEAPLWLDTATGQRKPGVAVPHTDCVCHDDALPCRGCGRIIPESVHLCIFCEEAGIKPRLPFEGLFEAAPDTAALEAQIAQLRAELEQERAAHAIEVEAGKQLATSLKYALADADGFGELLDWWEKEFPAEEGERDQAETHAEVRARVERSRDPLRVKIRRLENGAQVMHSLYASAKAEIEELRARLAHADEMIRRLTGVDAPPVSSSNELRAHVERLMGELDELRARVEVEP